MRAAVRQSSSWIVGHRPVCLPTQPVLNSGKMKLSDYEVWLWHCQSSHPVILPSLQNNSPTSKLLYLVAYFCPFSIVALLSLSPTQEVSTPKKASSGYAPPCYYYQNCIEPCIHPPHQVPRSKTPGGARPSTPAPKSGQPSLRHQDLREARGLWERGRLKVESWESYQFYRKGFPIYSFAVLSWHPDSHHGSVRCEVFSWAFFWVFVCRPKVTNSLCLSV